MSQDNNNQTTAQLVKVILAIQILTLTLIPYSYFRDSKLRTEYQNEIARYREMEADYQKDLVDYKREMTNYKLMADKYQEDVAAWEKSMSRHTNRASQSTNQ